MGTQARELCNLVVVNTLMAGDPVIMGEIIFRGRKVWELRKKNMEK